MDEPIVIVGAGLSGLCAAVKLIDAGRTIRLLEGSTRLGGRVFSVFENRVSSADLGPTWVWPSFQPTVSHWIKRLELETFDQFDAGDDLFDATPHSSPQRFDQPRQEGIARIVGGPWAFVEALAKLLPPDVVAFEHDVFQLEHSGAEVSVVVRDHDHEKTINASAVIVAASPRTIVERITFNPEPKNLARFSEIPTWMATHAKAVIRFSKPFWREDGLSGKVISRVGPLVEIHDHCGKNGEYAALFGFVGVPHARRSTLADGLLEQAIVDQLVRCFGEEAASPASLTIEDWARNSRVCSEADRTGAVEHPNIVPSEVRATQWSGRLNFAGAELSSESPGLIDGALSAGERAAEECLRLSNR